MINWRHRFAEAGHRPSTRRFGHISSRCRPTELRFAACV